MNGEIRTDVLVVGLGPAGACAAAEVARAGARVIAVDRRREAGLPVQCAELVPAMIGLDAHAVRAARRLDVAAMTTYIEAEGGDAGTVQRHEQPEFPGVMIDRAVFDAALAAEAGACGAECRFGVSVGALGRDGRARLSDGTEIVARLVIGADGPRSLVGKTAGAVNEEIAETRQVRVPLLKPFAATDIFLSPRIPGGYGWLFPKGDFANLGIGVAPPWRGRLKPLLAELHARLAEADRIGPQIHGYTGGAIPVGGLRRLVHRFGETAFILAGDAGGLTNPVTGAGINAAVISGRLAGEAAARAVAGDSGALEDYEQEIEALFGASIARALRRRREIMETYACGRAPGAADLKSGWIAFPEYWAA